MSTAAAPARLAEMVSRRPALLAAVLFMGGILCHQAAPPQIAIWLILTGLCTTLAWVTLRRQVLCSANLAAGIFLAGLVAAQLQAYRYRGDDVGLFTADQPRLAQLELLIDDPPRILADPFSQYRALPPKQTTTAAVRRVRTWNGWVDASGRVLVQIAQPHPRLAQGQTIRVLGLLQRPGPSMNPGQFDWAGYYRHQRTLASLHVPQADNIEIVASHRVWPLAVAREQVRRLLAAGFDSRHALDHALLRALLLGDSDPQLRDVQEQFQRTGTSHHLAISGLHVAVLGGFVFLLCRLLCLAPRTSAWAMMIFVICYGAVAQPSPPVIRSVLLCASFGIGMVTRRSLDSIQLLSLSVLVMLIYSPLDLYNAGFQLSFGTVLGLMIFTKPLMRSFASFGDEDVQIAASLQRPGRLADWWRQQKSMLLAALAAGCVAWAVSIPLIAFHFEQLNPWAIPGSLLLAPPVFAALIGGLLKVVLTLLWPGLAGVWAFLAAQPIALMRYLVDALASLPGSDMPVPAPPIWIIILYYVLLALPLLPRPRFRWPARVGPATACALAMLLPLQGGFARQSALRDEARLTLLAVGAGQCAVLELPGQAPVILDAGSITLTDPLRKCLGPYLRHRGHRAVRSVILSHANYDHFSAADDLVAAFSVREVYISPQFLRHATDNPAAEGLLARLGQLDAHPRLLSAGRTLRLGPITTLQVIWPASDLETDPNNSSIVLRLTHAGRRVLFTGDIQEPAQRALLRDSDTLRADVLIAPHHGSAESTTAAFIRAVNPKWILSSNDRTLTLKQQRLEELIGKRTLYRTHRCGAITVRITREGEMSVQTHLAVEGKSE